MWITLEVGIALLAIIVSMILYLRHHMNYWRNRGVPQIDAILLGNLDLSGHTSVQVTECYKYFRQHGFDYGGIYMLHKPVFLPVGVDFLKTIMGKDFEYFMNHREGSAREYDPLTLNLFNLEDEKWKSLRAKLTPTFTSGKMKMMFHTFLKCSLSFKKKLEEFAKNDSDVDIKDILGRFTTDIISSCAFGVECNSLEDPNSEFRVCGQKVFELNIILKLKVVFIILCPKIILRFLKIKLFPPETEDFFVKTVKEVVDYREQNNIYRKDFMHLLLQLKNLGKVSDDEKIKDDSNTNIKPFLNMDEITAQCFIFFLAGFETSSTAMTFALYELAIHQDLQDKLRTEIAKVLEKHDYNISYESVQEIKYLEQVIYESLRKYPPVGAITRTCSKDYKIRDTNTIIEKGTIAFIPVMGIHRDEEYYPNPEKFDPDRFTEENKAARPAFAFLPFGEGPRLCIGLRFGLLQSKVGLMTVIRNYKITLSPRTKLPLEFDRNAVVTAAKGDIWLKMTKI